MTDDERRRFLAQFTEARREVAALAKVFPACFDKDGKPIVAELRLIPTSPQRLKKGIDMGLDCSHDAFHGAYSAFNRLRQFVCAATGGSFPPHWIHSPTGELLKDERGATCKLPLPDDRFQCGGDYPRSEWPGLYEFLAHSDCDGEIDPAMCVKVADDLERLMPRMEALRWESHGHIAARGGFLEVVRKFIAGCRAAAAEGVPLDFH